MRELESVPQHITSLLEQLMQTLDGLCATYNPHFDVHGSGDGGVAVEEPSTSNNEETTML